MEQPEIIGHIDLSSMELRFSPSPKLTCDDCGDYCDDSFGDSRIAVTTYYANKANSVRHICSFCADTQFSPDECDNIFE